MVATRLQDFEKDDLAFIGGISSSYPYASLAATLRTKLAQEQESILQFFKDYPTYLEQPYGYDVFSGSANPHFKEDWQEHNALAMHMRRLGFGAFVPELSAAFSDCLYQAERVFTHLKSVRLDWALGLAQSAAALFLVHVLNIYVPQKGLFANILDANLQTDALGRLNYRSATDATAKAIKKTLGWKGDAQFRDDYRAEMVISLVEHERSLGRSLQRLHRGIDFEKKCGKILSSEGFGVRETPVSGDFGADLIAEKDGLTFAIQCKDLNKPVGVKAVQEAIGARRHYLVDFACVCADSGFTEAALELAASNRVITTNSGNLSNSLGTAR